MSNSVLHQINELESFAQRMKDNATLLLEKTATLKNELSGGSDSSLLRPKKPISIAMKKVLDRRRNQKVS